MEAVTLTRRERREIADLLYAEYDRLYETAIGNWGPELAPDAEAAMLAEAKRVHRLYAKLCPA